MGSVKLVGAVKRVLALALLMSAGFLGGCSTFTKKDPKVNLGRIYDDAAQSPDFLRNPVIVIPGLLGSKLTDSVTGKSVWGVFDDNYVDLNKAKNYPLVALPMVQKSPGRISHRAVPNGAMTSLKFRAAGVPLELQAYGGILKTLGVGGFRDSSLGKADINWDKEHFTCFQFDYDWRLSCVQNARRLDDFIREKKAYVQARSRAIYGKSRPDLKFNLVAHSMGGLIARYYLRYGGQPMPADGSAPRLSWAGARHLEQVVLVGTPNSGSVSVFRDLLEGKEFVSEWKRRLFDISLPNLPAGVLGTFPSLYELLPRARHRPVLNAQTNEPLDHLDPELWRRQKWGLLGDEEQEVRERLLPNAKPSQRAIQAYKTTALLLKNAEQFHRALDRPAKLPSGLKLSLIAGDAKETPRQLKVDLSSNELIDNDYRPGDGIVLRSSALADERAGQKEKRLPPLQSPLRFDQVTFLNQGHLEITRDPGFTDNLLWKLLEQPR